MRVAIIASPFLSVPPKRYGGTEQFIAHLATGLHELGIDVCVYTNGESKVQVERRWLFAQDEWPLPTEIYGNLKDLNHTSWALSDCWNDADIVHLNNAPGLAFARFKGGPLFAYTIHHPIKEDLSEYYAHFPRVQFVAISDFQRQRVHVPHIRTIHHGVDLSKFQLQSKKQDYLSFLGRIAPVKGVHTAIEVAKKSGIPLKIAGEVQPMFKDYFEAKIRPHIDGRFIEYLGEANLADKNELVGNSRAMLFPIEWDEPFGLVMIEAMATGTPVLAFRGGSVPEIVKDGISGAICNSAEEMAAKAQTISLRPSAIRTYVQQHFSVERMARDHCSMYLEMLGGKAAVAASEGTVLAADEEEPSEDQVA